MDISEAIKITSRIPKGQEDSYFQMLKHLFPEFEWTLNDGVLCIQRGGISMSGFEVGE